MKMWARLLGEKVVMELIDETHQYVATARALGKQL